MANEIRVIVENIEWDSEDKSLPTKVVIDNPSEAIIGAANVDFYDEQFDSEALEPIEEYLVEKYGCSTFGFTAYEDNPAARAAEERLVEEMTSMLEQHKAWEEAHYKKVCKSLAE